MSWFNELETNISSWLMMDMIPSLWMGFRVGWVAKLSRWKAFPDNFTNKNKNHLFILQLHAYYSLWIKQRHLIQLHYRKWYTQSWWNWQWLESCNTLSSLQMNENCRFSKFYWVVWLSIIVCSFVFPDVNFGLILWS